MGGSGKTTVICLVICYARKFCDHLGHPFTIQTIVTTAFSGVAATLIFGETIHSSMGLMRQHLKQDMIDAWSDARLVIIDECSYASYALFNKIEQNARTLMGNKMKFYGGLNIV
jgi:PIF1-like helicase